MGNRNEVRDGRDQWFGGAASTSSSFGPGAHPVRYVMPSPRGIRDVTEVALAQRHVDETMAVLRAFGRRHLEGLVLWFGVIDGARASVYEVSAPPQTPIADETGVGYLVDGDTLAAVNIYLEENRLRLLAQVHSHPGRAYHSAMDDRYATVTQEGGFSLVVPDFAAGSADVATWANYRLLDRHWREMSASDVARTFKLV